MKKTKMVSESLNEYFMDSEDNVSKFLTATAADIENPDGWRTPSTTIDMDEIEELVSFHDNPGAIQGYHEILKNPSVLDNHKDEIRDYEVSGDSVTIYWPPVDETTFEDGIEFGEYENYNDYLSKFS